MGVYNISMAFFLMKSFLIMGLLKEASVQCWWTGSKIGGAHV